MTLIRMLIAIAMNTNSDITSKKKAGGTQKSSYKAILYAKEEVVVCPPMVEFDVGVMAINQGRAEEPTNMDVEMEELLVVKTREGENMVSRRL